MNEEIKETIENIIAQIRYQESILGQSREGIVLTEEAIKGLIGLYKSWRGALNDCCV